MSVSAGFARHAVRTAVIATAVVAGLILVLCVAVDVVVVHALRSSAEKRLSAELLQLIPGSGGRALDEPDLDDPLLVWRLDDAGHVVQATPGAPALPARARAATAPTEMPLAGGEVLVDGASFQGGRLIGAISLAAESSSFTTLLVTEAVIGPILLVLVFGGAFFVGRHAAGPIERVRRRQLEFTADASHELRTPLAVIEAETSLALANVRPGDTGVETIERVAAETRRMRTIVEDLLWLSRFDSMPPDPAAEAVDIATAVDVGVHRFVTIADRQGIRLDNLSDPTDPALVDAPAEYIDRLVGVLLDNACRYTPRGGRVTVAVTRDRQRVRLLVADTGPGFPKDRRERVFDRFHRATSEGDGAGLGLAIANAIVGATRGRWEIDDMPEGGASVGVVWHGSRARFTDRGDGQRAPRARGDGSPGVVD
ncbi:MAG TPA: HAMP domain-containing sensor histidine kinase [Candidatus Acidoferrales bacterium]|nr:HAMP domain-containing sensor histidine kinase [Candidatus Acidoferrales bacterium]